MPGWAGPRAPPLPAKAERGRCAGGRQAGGSLEQGQPADRARPGRGPHLYRPRLREGGARVAGRLVVVSNRVSLPTGRGGAGGLAVGLQSALRERGGLWFGWSGKHSGEPSDVPEIVEQGRVTYA